MYDRSTRGVGSIPSIRRHLPYGRTKLSIPTTRSTYKFRCTPPYRMAIALLPRLGHVRPWTYVRSMPHAPWYDRTRGPPCIATAARGAHSGLRNGSERVGHTAHRQKGTRCNILGSAKGGMLDAVLNLAPGEFPCYWASVQMPFGTACPNPCIRIRGDDGLPAGFPIPRQPPEIRP
eukprot:SAG31_NODE_1800_length_7238_cov_4.818602_6_plen_176_part_00